MSTVYIWGEANRYENYRRAIEALGSCVRFRGEPSSCDALLLPGGGDLEPWRYGQKKSASRGLEPLRDTAELALLEEFTACRKPVLGICRGLQTINVFFGGTLLQDIPGHSAADGIDRLHKVQTAPSPLQVLCGERCIVNSSHHQAVDRPGSGLQIVQWAPDGTVEAISHRKLPVWAVQWHPERLNHPMGKQLLSWFLSQYR